MVQQWRNTLLVVILFALAFWLRLQGIENGLPLNQVADETADLTRGFEILQGQTPTYTFHRVTWSLLQLPLHGVYAVLEGGTNRTAFERLYFTQRNDFILNARLWTVFFSLMTIAITILVGKFLTQRWWWGLAMGLLLTVHPASVYLAKVALPDTSSVLGVAVALWASIGIAKTGERRWYWLGGVSCALVVLTRLQAISIIVALLVGQGVFYRQGGRISLLNWLHGVLIFVVTSLLLNPFILLAPQACWEDIQAIFGERVNEVRYGLDAPETPTQANYAQVVQNNAPLPLHFLRLPFVILASMGILMVIWRREWVWLPVAVFGLVFVLSLLALRLPRITYWLPAAVPVALLGGYAVYTLGQAGRGGQMAGGLLCLLVVASGMYESQQVNRAMTATKTQVLAYDFFVQSVPPFSAVLLNEPFIHSLPLARTPESMQRMAEMGDLPRSYRYWLDNPEVAPTPQYNVFGEEYAPTLTSEAAWWEFVHRNGIEYVIETDYCRGDWGQDGQGDATYPVLTRSLRAELDLIYSTSPFEGIDCQTRIETRTPMEHMELTLWTRVGPIIRIYRVPKDEPHD